MVGRSRSPKREREKVRRRFRGCFFEGVFFFFFLIVASNHLSPSPYLCLGCAALRGLFPRREQAPKLRRHVLVVGVVLRRRRGAGPAPGHDCFRWRGRRFRGFCLSMPVSLSRERGRASSYQRARYAIAIKMYTKSAGAGRGGEFFCTSRGRLD